jgi:hypothetical protein
MLFYIGYEAANRSKTKFIKFMQQYFRKKKILYLHESTHTHMKYKRILLKLSGEALMGDLQYGIDPKDLPNMLTK